MIKISNYTTNLNNGFSFITELVKKPENFVNFKNAAFWRRLIKQNHENSVQVRIFHYLCRTTNRKPHHYVSLSVLDYITPKQYHCNRANVANLFFIPQPMQNSTIKLEQQINQQSVYKVTMQYLVLVFLAAVAVYAEPPSSKQVKPLGVQFAKQEAVPQVYFIPPDYRREAAPKEATTQATPQDFSPEPESEQISVVSKPSESNENDRYVQQGTYYVYHPTGLLQRIVYGIETDVKNMGFTAQLRYQNVEPINDPIYTYDPNTYVLQQLQVWWWLCVMGTTVTIDVILALLIYG